MCGRFNVIDNPELQRLLQELGIDLGLPSRANIAPTETIAMVRELDGQRQLAQVRWWLTPAWARQVDQKYAMFNARCETIATSRAYAEPFKRRRGVVPVSSFIEWRSEDGARQPYLIAARDEALALAAVWDCWRGEDQVIESCALVTTAAAPQFEQVHKRMPVMLTTAEQQRWLDCEVGISPEDSLFEARLKQPLSVQAISRQVNNARNKALELLHSETEALLLEAG
jgi:putative SOS response-associated peptidase YedK